jgi:hypothetical protein
MNQLTQFSLKPVPKSEREAIVQQVRDSILSGDTNPLDAEIALKGLEEMADAIRKAIRPYVATEASKYGENTFEHNGTTIELSSRRTYNFSKCNDEYWTAQWKAETTAKEARAEREKFLKAIPPEGVVNTNTGEIIAPPTYTTADIITIKIK